jgi:hypothetical protein
VNYVIAFLRSLLKFTCHRERPGQYLQTWGVLGLHRHAPVPTGGELGTCKVLYLAQASSRPKLTVGLCSGLVATVNSRRLVLSKITKSSVGGPLPLLTRLSNPGCGNRVLTHNHGYPSRIFYDHAYIYSSGNSFARRLLLHFHP